MNSQDFSAGVDFTGVNPVTGADHNNLVDLAVPVEDTGPEVGKGMILVTTDSALDTPDVPNATITTKWKRYAWFRRPFAGADDKASILYIWNDDAVSVATYLKWIRVNADLTQVEVDVANALATAQNAQTTVELFSNALNDVTTTANQALATANTASVNANTALTDSAESLVTANAASETANNAETIANNALTAANNNKTLAQITVGAAAGQRIRSNSTNTNWEGYLIKDTYVKFSETQAKNTDGGNAVTGVNLRTINTEDSDTGALASVAANLITLAAGVYKVNAMCIGRNVGTHQAFLVRNSDNVVLLTGSSISMAGSAVNTPSLICGIITLVGATVLRIDHYFSGNATNGFGLAANLHPDAAGKEVYSTIEFEQIG